MNTVYISQSNTFNMFRWNLGHFAMQKRTLAQKGNTNSGAVY